MKNRSRNRQFKIWLDEKEWEVFHQKFKMSKSKNMTEFIVRCVFEKEIFVLDMQPFRELQQLLSNEANNINQIARHANRRGEVNKNDIKYILNANLKQSKEILKLQKIIYKKSNHN